jgi:hypothetical protein
MFDTFFNYESTEYQAMCIILHQTTSKMTLGKFPKGSKFKFVVFDFVLGTLGLFSITGEEDEIKISIRIE